MPTSDPVVIAREPADTPFLTTLTTPESARPTFAIVFVLYNADLLTKATVLPAATALLEEVLSVWVTVVILYDDNVWIAILEALLIAGGLAGTNFPSTWFNWVILSVTVVSVVSVTALLTNVPIIVFPKVKPTFDLAVIILLTNKLLVTVRSSTVTLEPLNADDTLALLKYNAFAVSTTLAVVNIGRTAVFTRASV